MSMLTLGLAEEFRSKQIAVNSLWPKTAIATSAVEFEAGGQELFKLSRTYALTALIKDGLSQSLPSEKLLMKSQIASLSASFLTR